MPQPSRKIDSGRERARTDAGLTGDKVAVGDPAAAPVHTDAETAGTPTPAKLSAASVRRQERIAKAARPKAGLAPFAADRQPFGGHGGGGALTAGALVALVLAGVLAGIVSVSAI